MPSPYAPDAYLNVRRVNLKQYPPERKPHTARSCNQGCIDLPHYRPCAAGNQSSCLCALRTASFFPGAHTSVVRPLWPHLWFFPYNLPLGGLYGSVKLLVGPAYSNLVGFCKQAQPEPCTGQAGEVSSTTYVSMGKIFPFPPNPSRSRARQTAHASSFDPCLSVEELSPLLSRTCGYGHLATDIHAILVSPFLWASVQPAHHRLVR